MRAKTMNAIILALAVLPFAGGISHAQQARSSQTDVPAILKQMTVAGWSVRCEAFHDARRLLASRAISSIDSDRLRLGIIDLLVLENSRIMQTDQTDFSEPERDEAHSNYYATLIDTVAGFGDERAIPALLGAAGSGGMATEGVARFGTQAVPPVVREVRGSDMRLAANAMWVIRDMLRYRTVTDEESLDLLKDTVRSALSSPNFELRNCALRPVEYLRDREEFIPILTELAAHDPAKRGPRRLSTPNVGDFYPVRHQAALLLKKIKNHEPVPFMKLDSPIRPDTAQTGTCAKPK